MQKRERPHGLVAGDLCRWNAQGFPVARITCIHVDANGDTWFDLSFKGDKPVRVEADEVLPYKRT